MDTAQKKILRHETNPNQEEQGFQGRKRNSLGNRPRRPNYRRNPIVDDLSHCQDHPRNSEYIRSSLYPYIIRRRARPRKIDYDQLPEKRLDNALLHCKEVTINHSKRNISLTKELVPVRKRRF